MTGQAFETTDGRRTGLRLLSASPAARRSVALVSRQLSLPQPVVADLMARAPCLLPLAEGAGDLSRVAALLTALGLRVERVDQARAEPVFLALLPKDGTDIAALAALLAEPLGQPVAELTANLSRPDGHVLEFATREAAQAMTRRLRRIGSVQIVPLRPQSALYDVYAGDCDSPGLAAHLRLMGHDADPVTGALAAGLDHHGMRHVKRLFAGACILDRAVQRFDLWLVRSGDWRGDDLADFLMARTGLPRARFADVRPDNPIRLETGLSRDLALRFRADYAAIGLQITLSLMAAPGRENP